MTDSPEKLITGEELLESMIIAHQSLSDYRRQRISRRDGDKARVKYLKRRDIYLKNLSARVGNLLTARVIDPINNPKKPLAGPILTTSRTLRSFIGLHDSTTVSSPDETSGFLQDIGIFSSALELAHPDRGFNRPLNSTVSVINPLTLEPLVTLHFADEI